jgi:hypothetical protein
VTRIVLVLLVFLAACAEPPPVVESARVAEIAHDQIAEQFGADLDPAREVARVGDRSITVAEVAAWLELFPTLTVEQAVADLVDAASVAAAQSVHVDEILTRDAVVRGRFYTWASRVMFPEIDATAPTDEDVAAFAGAVENTTLWGIPELMQVSHILFRAAGPAVEGQSLVNDAVRAQAAAAAAELRVLPFVDAVALRRYALAHATEFTAASLTATVEPHFQFPQRYSGATRWDGAPAVVDAFADAVFAVEPGTFIGPLETEFGVHLVVVEARIPALLPDEPTRLEMAHDMLLSRHRSAALATRLDALMATASITVEPDAVNMLGAPESDRVQLEQQGMQQRFE